MRVGVYAIAKNEAKHVNRFMDSIGDAADDVAVVDTGSDDGTRLLLERRGARVMEYRQVPWRFDAARNVSLEFARHADPDVLVCLDLDEVISPGWRAAVEEAWLARPELTRIRYPYVWSHLPDGSPDIAYMYDKIHSAKGAMSWVGACHEVLEFKREEAVAFVARPIVTHLPDGTKDRRSYLPLLMLATKERPDDPRLCFYYLRELVHRRMFKPALREAQRYHDMAKEPWPAEVAAVLRYEAKARFALRQPKEAMILLERAIGAAPEERDARIELAAAQLYGRHPAAAIRTALGALRIQRRPSHHLTSGVVWTSLPLDMIAAATMELEKCVASGIGAASPSSSERSLSSGGP